MVFALETYWPTEDSSAAARIEEEVYGSLLLDMPGKSGGRGTGKAELAAAP